MADENTASADTEPESPKAIAKAKKKPADAAADDSAGAEKASAKDDDEEDEDESGPTKKARKQDLILDAGVKEALLRVLTDALERLMALANTIKDAAEPDEGDAGEAPDDVTTELEAIAEMLSSAQKRKRPRPASPRPARAWRRTGSTGSRRRCRCSPTSSRS